MRHHYLRLGAIIICCASPVLGTAQDLATPSAQGGIRRVAVPAPGHTGPRITIQITAEEHAWNTTPPAELAAAEATDAPVASAPAPTDTGTASWFWASVPPSLPADPSRFFRAQDHIAAAPEAADLRVPRLSTLHDIVTAHGTDILMASVGTGVSPAMVLAVMAVESAGRPEAVSSAGAQGLMQLIPATADRFGVSDPFDPAQNIAGGVAYLDWLLGEFGGDPLLALAGYNAGEGAVRNAGGVPPFAETRDYVPKVLATWMMARTLCRTPPELVSDGCVFMPIAVN
ncbi:transglycosylase SLT domain-containing protein [Rhodobacterales bacterium HKCCSP123]|nr:transglycosylase SLT domain-containing protein [Rhodobacterales bacterium HKCCSP123]